MSKTHIKFKEDSHFIHQTQTPTMQYGIPDTDGLTTIHRLIDATKTRHMTKSGKEEYDDPQESWEGN